MSEGGVSHGELSSAIGSVRSELLAEIRELDGRVRGLEAEMGELSNAIDRMNDRLAGRLEAIQRQQAEIGSTLAESLQTQEKTLTATEVGLAGAAAATFVVNGSLRRNTTAVVHTDVLRTCGDALAPLSQVRGFAAEIEERFGQALVNVAMNRQLYDQHFQDILVRHDRKLRAIGEHIYRVMEQEFIPAVEERVAVPRTAYQDLALEVDRQRIAMRSRRLESKLAQFDHAELDPMLEMHHRFETAISGEYSVDLPQRVDDVAVPAALRVWVDGDADVVFGTAAAPDTARAAVSGVGYSWEDDPRYDAIRAAAAGRAREIAAGASFHPLGAADLQRLRAALIAQAEAGRIDGDLLPGMFAYLNTHGIEVTDDCAAVLAAADEGGAADGRGE